MTRPTRITVNAGDNSWESQVNTNLQNLFDRPIPILLHAGDLASLESARPAAQYEWCLALCQYNAGATPGNALAFSDGTSWRLASDWKLLNRRILTETGSVHSVADGDDLIVTTGSGTFNVTLPAIANGNKGRVITIKHAGTGTITVQRSGADTIDGGTSFTIDTQYDAFAFVSDGASNWHVLKFGASGGGGGGASAFTGLTDTPGSYTGEEGKLVRVNSTEDGLEFVAGEDAIVIEVTRELGSVGAATAAKTFRMPWAMTLTEVRASLNVAASTGTVTVDINESGATVLSTKITIDATEKTSTTAASAAVISDASLADDAEITIDVDDDADGNAQGLKVTLIGRKA